MFNDPRLKRWLSLVLIVLAGIGITVALTDTDGDGMKDTLTIHVDGVDRDRKADDTIEVPKAAVAEAAAATESDLKDETPPIAEAAPGQLAANQKTVETVRDDLEPLPTAGATQGFPGCRTSFVRNQSSRNGVRPIWQVLHYTVSPNRPGWSDVNAIVAFFNQSSAQVSSHFVIDGEGHCAYIVPIEAKAWANAAGNSLSIQYEIINSGTETTYLAPAGLRRLRAVELEVKRRTGISVSQGSVYPARRGTVQHKDGLLAWGGHHDISPFSLVQVIKYLTVPAQTPITTADRARCRRAKAYHARKHHTVVGRRIDKKRHRLMKSRRLACVGGRVHRLKA